MEGKRDKWKNGGKKERMKRSNEDELVDKWKDEWKKGWMKERMDGRKNRCMEG